ncbi:MAG: D-cysteine desulfhydrase family protein [Chloroflexi bacterium]|nr:D-cysteine desulfhydrase family protein [Chloroflexota bacterium]
MEARAPRVPLAHLPTPLDEAPRLAAALAPDNGQRGPRILIKRDDLTGLAFGGNKTRKLEYLIGAALHERCKAVITTGAAQSNHARQTAAAAAKVGLEAYLVLRPPIEGLGQGNLLIDELVGAHVILCASRDEASARIQSLAEELRDAGRPAYVIPVGGSTPVGALGYAQCVVELQEQLAERGVEPAGVYFASSSAGTQAGMLAGARGCGVAWSIWGVAVEPNGDEFRREIAELATQTASLAGPGARFEVADVLLETGFAGPAYGVYTPEADAALRLLARTEAILLDPVYTAKAMAGLIGHIRAGRYGPDDTVVFIHTGGTPALFAYADQISRTR